MARKKKKSYSWRDLKTPARIRMSIAAFFLFGTMGPLSVLMQSAITDWMFILRQTLLSGGMSLFIVLVGNRWRWTIGPIIILFTFLIFLNSGGISVGVDENGTLRTEISGLDTSMQSGGHPVGAIGIVTAPRPHRVEPESITLQRAEIQALSTQRTILGLVIILFMSLGYIMLVRVIRREVTQRARLETEMTIAREIQQSLLTTSTLDLPWCSVAGRMIPATEVGGDYFDFIQTGSGRISLCIADVTGHGVGAGILSAMTKSAYRSQVRNDPSPLPLLTNLNSTLYGLSGDKMFVTFAYAAADHAAGVLHLSTAGHQPLLLYSAEGVTQVRTPSLALGLREHAEFSSRTLPICQGDLLLMFTDGVVETTNAKEEQFGLERLASLLHDSGETPSALLDRIFAELKKHRGSEIFDDDMTIVAVRFHNHPPDRRQHDG